MKKLTVSELRRDLLNEEMNFTKLDNSMMRNGYHSVFNDGATLDIKECKNVIYTATDSGECEIKIDFEITIDNEENEIKENFYLKVTAVEDFGNAEDEKQDLQVLSKELQEIKERATKGNGYIKYNGVTYYFTDNGAYADNYENEVAIFADAYTGETDDYEKLVLFKIRWEYVGHDQEDMTNAADWDNPIEIFRQ